MMIEIPLKYEASFFGSIGDIEPSADTIPAFLDMFRDKLLLPSTFQEIGVGEPRVRLRLSSSDNEWHIDFPTLRIIFRKNLTTPGGANMGTPEDFTQEVMGFCQRILRQFPKDGTRLALVTEGLMGEIPEEQLHAVYHRLFKSLEFYASKPLVEWKSRSVARVAIHIGGHEESVNVITNADRARGKFGLPDGVTTFDRIALGFDINTSEDNSEPRFDMESVAEYYPKALGLRARVLSQLEEVINV